MQAAAVDISVLLLFFTRPDRLRQVFQQVQKARPARLFLYQDGPRTNADDEQIAACRAVVADSAIDWQCTVYRNYQEHNSGCDPSEYLAQKWAFQHTDKLIVLEDDDVPAVSFFAFCKELLDRYEDDSSIGMIAGFNAMETVPLRESYFPTQVFSIWGWASWRRVFNTWDATYSWLDNEQYEKVAAEIARWHLRRDFLALCQQHKASGIPHYETIFWAALLLHGQQALMTTKNQITNIGVPSLTEKQQATHFTTTFETMPRRMRRQFTMARYEVPFPLVHATETTAAPTFLDDVYRRNAWNHPWRKVQYSLEELFWNLRYRRFAAIAAALRRRLSPLLPRP